MDKPGLRSLWEHPVKERCWQVAIVAHTEIWKALVVVVMVQRTACYRAVSHVHNDQREDQKKETIRTACLLKSPVAFLAAWARAHEGALIFTWADRGNKQVMMFENVGRTIATVRTWRPMAVYMPPGAPRPAMAQLTGTTHFK